MAELSAAPVAGSIDRGTIERAHRRIARFVHRTPVLTSGTFDRMLGAELYFKCENLQKVGAFKIRGATNAVLSLSDEQRRRGVVTHSSGNHAQALALAAQRAGCRAVIVMPRTAPAVKRAAVEGYGAEVRSCEPTLAARQATAAAVVEETGGVLVHPYENEAVIAGAATAAKELLAEIPGLDLLVAPVGGGGLIVGSALAARYFAPGTRVIGAEPAGADDAYRSLAAGRIVPVETPSSVADGLLSTVGRLTFPLIARHVESIVRVEEPSIVDAMKLLFERMKLVVEPSGAVPLAALLSGELDLAALRIGVILSGGNVDLDRLPWLGAER